MNIYQIFAVIIGILIIAHCFVYAVFRPKAFSNITDIIVFGGVAIGSTSMTLAHPSWWTVGISMYILILFRISVCANTNRELWNFGYYGYNLSHFRKFLRVLLSWITLITIFLISTKMLLMSSSWSMIITYFPIAAWMLIIVSLHVKRALESLD